MPDNALISWLGCYYSDGVFVDWLSGEQFGVAIIGKLIRWQITIRFHGIVVQGIPDGGLPIHEED